MTPSGLQSGSPGCQARTVRRAGHVEQEESHSEQDSNYRKGDGATAKRVRAGCCILLHLQRV